MGRWLERLKSDPTPWLQEKACPSIRYRTLTEIHGRPEDDPDVVAVRQEVYKYKPPHTISTGQNDDGTWHRSLDGFEAVNNIKGKGPGTTVQFHALLEYGWDRDHPIMWRTIQLLQAMLFEDPSIDLMELKGYCGGDASVEQWLRKRLSSKALALLCRCGLSDDPGVRHLTGPFLARVEAFYAGDPAGAMYCGEYEREIETPDGPDVEVFQKISPDAVYPDRCLMMVFAHHQGLKNDPRARAVLENVVSYMFEHPNPEKEGVFVGGKFFERDQDFGIRRLERKDYEERKLLGQLLQDLELLARCGVLESVPRAVELLEWVISLQDDEGVVQGDAFIEKTFNRVDYPYFPLEDNWRGKHKKFTDITFRLFLILSILDSDTP